MNRREELLNGTISFPKQIMDLVNPNESQKELIKGLWDSLGFTFLSDKTLLYFLLYSFVKNILL